MPLACPRPVAEPDLPTSSASGARTRRGGGRPSAMRHAVLLTLLVLTGCQTAKELAVETVVAGRRDAAGLVERDATVDGRRVAYLERPGRGPALVLLHGFGAQKDAWLDFADALPRDRRLLIPDLPGHGGSEAGAGEYDARRLADDVGAWLAATAAGPVDLAGNSLGGLIATLIAAERPERVRRLVLMDPAGVPAPRRSGLDSLLASGTNPLIPTTRADYDRLVSFVFADDPGIPGPARDVLAAETRERAPFLRALFANLQGAQGDVRPILPSVRQPVLVIWGARDRVLDPSAAPLWIDALPNGRLVMLPDVGHAPMMEAPDDTARLTSTFLR